MTTIAFIGAGSAVFTRQLLQDLFRLPNLPRLDFRFHDVDPERADTALRVGEHLRERMGAEATCLATTDLAQALDGCDFVVNMIQVGGITSTLVDFEVAARFGLRQTIADTIGVGGIFRGLRTFPALTKIVEQMRRSCPDALLMNYTNPMAMNLWWMQATAPDIKSIGLCHSVFWTVNDLCGLLGIPVSEVDYRAAGVNHQAWVLEWKHRGASLYPRLDALIASDDNLRRRVRVDMYRRFGFYPTETSEHSSEYLPWYLRSDAEIERLRIPVGEYIEVSRENVREYEQTRATLLSGGTLEIEEGEAAEYAPQIIHAMVTGEQTTIHGNTRNFGLISNLPEGACVEVPCTVDALGVHPQAMGELPPQCAALNRTFLNVVELTVRAALDEDPKLIRNAMMLDPNAAATLTTEQIFALADALVDAHGDVLPAWARATVPGGSYATVDLVGAHR